MLKLKWMLIWPVLVVLLAGCRGTDPPVEEPTAAAGEPVSPAVSAADMERAATRAVAAETRAPTNALGVEPTLPVATGTASVADLLPDLGQAPELANKVWLNSAPLTMAGLRGKVVLVEFWTFG